VRCAALPICGALKAWIMCHCDLYLLRSFHGSLFLDVSLLTEIALSQGVEAGSSSCHHPHVDVPFLRLSSSVTCRSQSGQRLVRPP
jgi:hypothetical protein